VKKQYQSTYISPQGQSVLRLDENGQLPIRSITRRLGSRLRLARAKGPGRLLILWRLHDIYTDSPTTLNQWINRDAQRLLRRTEVYGPAVLAREPSLDLSKLAEYYLPLHRCLEGLKGVDTGLGLSYRLARRSNRTTMSSRPEPSMLDGSIAVTIPTETIEASTWRRVELLMTQADARTSGETAMDETCMAEETGQTQCPDSDPCPRHGCSDDECRCETS
jgi:hypothetical protein